MLKCLIRAFGLKGSWKWAIRQMKRGEIVRIAHATGTIKRKIDSLENGRIVEDFGINEAEQNWISAYVFLGDFNYTDWVVFHWGDALGDELSIPIVSNGLKTKGTV